MTRSIKLFNRRLRAGNWIVGVCVGLVVSGCSAHNMWNVKTRITAKALTKTAYPLYPGNVFLTPTALTKAIVAEPIAELDVGTVTKQSPGVVLKLLADKARESGANAVFKVRVWTQGAGFSWESPQASGMAVRLTDTNCLAGLSGDWR